MLFEFDADQRMLRDTVREVTARACPPSLIRDVVDKEVEPGTLWQTYADVGWTELSDPALAVELAIVLEGLGRATDPTPFLATMTQYAPLAGNQGKLEQPGAAVYSGVTATAGGDGWRLDGTARHVLDGDRAQRLAVATDAGVFTVPAAAVTATRDAIFDPVLHLAQVSFDGVRVGPGDRCETDPERARQHALTGIALTTVGACQRILDLVLEHVRTRRQFDAPIGSFQAVKHKAADMHIAIERARALGYFAALCLAADDPRRRLAASMAKASAGECQSVVFRHGLQLFGAMGFTWENDLQFALKRAKAGELMLGGAASHRALIAEEYRAALV
ncbi:alkylation response protein AidB-like acyl-CoA dehydrogenase [Nocardia transvalensis]|uniref:Alkylation response protein AidB-like acyl-CoA dehydrogenase n=1 Tax=Nocardia transvalensis TaxID=37333 RepID=A0A7W9PGZ7_9NOCA|nr:acyl-CoA dehydrogenase family protein [Nocardia transvalensis]MBB5915434.1 alkylation response protein AidB-like acyl-CoA dehydrogenase [Nocardia transvalensis]